MAGGPVFLRHPVVVGQYGLCPACKLLDTERHEKKMHSAKIYAQILTDRINNMPVC